MSDSASELATYYSESAITLREMADNDDDLETKAALLRIAEKYEKSSTNCETGVIQVRNWRR